MMIARMVLMIGVLLLAGLSTVGFGRSVASNYRTILLPYDPNMTCRRWITENEVRQSIWTDEAVCVLLQVYEENSGKHWTGLFGEENATNAGIGRNWLSCAPFQEPLEHIDLNGDGVTDLMDYAVAANCGYVSRYACLPKVPLETPQTARFWFVIMAQTYHLPSCSLCDDSGIVTVAPSGYAPCLICHPELATNVFREFWDLFLN